MTLLFSPAHLSSLDIFTLLVLHAPCLSWNLTEIDKCREQAGWREDRMWTLEEISRSFSMVFKVHAHHKL